MKSPSKFVFAIVSALTISSAYGQAPTSPTVAKPITSGPASPAPTAQRAEQQAAQAANRDAQRAMQQAQQASQRAQRAAQQEQNAALRELSRMDSMGVRGARSHKEPTEKEQLAIAALEGLMSVPPERALPLLKKVLAGPQSVLVKSRALFVLSQCECPGATQILVDTASRAEPDLKVEAIRALGLMGEASGVQALEKLFDSADSTSKAAILEALMIADSAESIFNIAMRSNNDVELEQAIQLLGAMEARSQLKRLGAAGRGSKHLVEAYAISGDVESLVKLTQAGNNLNIRETAARNLGIIGSEPAKQALVQIYQSSKEASIRASVIEGLSMCDGGPQLLQLYKLTNDTQEKRKILQVLATQDSDAAMQAIDAALNGNVP